MKMAGGAPRKTRKASMSTYDEAPPCVDCKHCIVGGPVFIYYGCNNPMFNGGKLDKVTGERIGPLRIPDASRIRTATCYGDEFRKREPHQPEIRGEVDRRIIEQDERERHQELMNMFWSALIMALIATLVWVWNTSPAP